MKVHYPKLYNMAHLLALNVLLLPKDLTIIFIIFSFSIQNIDCGYLLEPSHGGSCKMYPQSMF